MYWSAHLAEATHPHHWLTSALKCLPLTKPEPGFVSIFKIGWCSGAIGVLDDDDNNADELFIIALS
eukprot:scaffold143331_cov44-Prasinocladus_malaysianus.AAC.1